MRPGAVFLQWLQGYEVDPQVVRTAYSTLGSVFPAIESWQTQGGDLLLMASRQPLVHDLDLVRARVRQEPYRTALSRIWGVEGAEGFYASYLASPAFARAVRAAEGETVNTDDHPILEFGFAKNLGRVGLFQVNDLIRLARERGEDHPATRGVPLDWNRARELRGARTAYWNSPGPEPDPGADEGSRKRAAARNAWTQGNPTAACQSWLGQAEPPRTHADRLLVAECMAAVRHPAAPQYARQLVQDQPIEADLVLAQWLANVGRTAEAGERLLAGFAGYRRDPWVHRPLMAQSLTLAVELAARDRALAARLWDALGQPFAARMHNQQRVLSRLWVARSLDAPRLCAEALAPMEPHVPWGLAMLSFRSECYSRRKHPLAARARRDLEEFLENTPERLDAGMEPAR
jgi:hypothetical protein